jgi:predicted PurR-regulated permease PerM
MIISFFEYTIIYYIIGLPNALLLGSLCSLSNLIPFFGGIIVQIISVISSFAISKKLGIFVLIIAFILSIFDSYVLNPIIYSKSNKIHPIIIICSVLISGSLLGLFGILFAIPSAIVIITTYKYLKNKNIQ